MRMKSNLALVGMGVAGTLLYQNIKNGNMRRMANKAFRNGAKAINNLEDMM